MRRALARKLARVAEDERAVLEGARVLHVVARVGDHAPEAPRILRHQLGVGVDEDVDGPAVLLRVGDLQAEQRAAPAVRRHVGALELHPVDGRERVPHVACAAGELRRRRDPRVVDPEGDGVEQLQRRRDDAAHLPRDVPAVRVEPAVLEAEHLRPGPRGDLAPVLQALVHRQLRRRGLRRPRPDRRQRAPRSDCSPNTHSSYLRPRASPRTPLPVRSANASDRGVLAVGSGRSGLPRAAPRALHLDLLRDHVGADHEREGHDLRAERLPRREDAEPQARTSTARRRGPA